MIRILSSLAAVAMLIGTAMAADAPNAPKAPAKTVAAIFDWTGFSVGAHMGYAMDKMDAQGVGTTVTIKPDGVFGGMQAGYGYEFRNRWYAGIVGDVSMGDVKGSTTAFGTTIPAKANLFGTARLKIGYNMNPMLVYGTGGLAWSRNDISITGSGLPKAEQTQLGYAVGMGFEVPVYVTASGNAMTMGMEYLYLGMGGDNYCFGIGVCVPIKATGQRATVIANYHW